MKILKKGVVEKRGEEETKSIHAPCACVNIAQHFKVKLKIPGGERPLSGQI